LQGETFNKGSRLTVSAGAWQELGTFTCGLAGNIFPKTPPWRWLRLNS
jgi:hypothetical protein